MCGIAGIISKNMPINSAKNVQSALAAMKHRGPDDLSIFEDANIVFGYVRLAIRGLDNSFNQPLKWHSSEDNSYIFFGNGEVYSSDFCNLSNDECDLIPLAKAIPQQGLDIYDIFDADFAIAMWDKKSKIFYLARDFFGIKPLFISWINSDTLAFASEIKGLKHLVKTLQPDNETVFDYLLFGYPLPPRTFYLDVYMLPPGSILKWDILNDAISLKSKLLNEIIKPSGNFCQSHDDIILPLRKSVSNRMISDCPLGFHLSGGLDSSLITYLANSPSYNSKNYAITMFRNMNDNDLYYSQMVAKDLYLHHITEKLPDEFDLKPLINILDCPIMSSGAFVPMNIAKKSSSLGIKVLLAGQGADELLMGYSRFNDIMPDEPFDTLFDKLINIDIPFLFELFPSICVNNKNIHQRYHEWFTCENNFKKVAQNFYMLTFLQELLKIEDHTHMAFSIENRVPYLSLPIYEWLNTPKSQNNDNSNINKYNIWKAHQQLGTKVSERTAKENMNGSLPDMLASAILLLRDKILNNKFKIEGLDYFKLEQLLNEVNIKSMPKRKAQLIWAIYNIHLWLDSFDFNKINLSEINNQSTCILSNQAIIYILGGRKNEISQ